MSLTLKLASLAIRTLAKPVANSIKSRAREHETFRKTFIRFAQSLHRVDMRMRLGILHDSAAQERMHAREVADQAAKEAKKKADAGKATARTEAEQKKFEEEEKARADGAKEQIKQKQEERKTKIRPLSESRAIELGANFASESFIFMVAAGLLVFERWWSRRKENIKDEHVVERIAALEEQASKVTDLEAEVLRLRAQQTPDVQQEAKSQKTKTTEVGDVSETTVANANGTANEGS